MSGLMLLGCFVHQYKPCKFCFRFETSQSGSQCRAAFKELESCLLLPSSPLPANDKGTAEGSAASWSESPTNS
ncbi:hypothetical protein WJX84_002702 [Apatococcus fuscideae]|uniref:Uncharacterized protein n=1 Tax=Apatococcus fuscideae TaxID=2026836 RepID=A0AAW1T195_9CHLO